MAAKTAKLWLQLGHAGALAYGPTSNPQGPECPRSAGSALRGNNIGRNSSFTLGVCEDNWLAQQRFWRCANSRGARILLSQFLSPLFNKRSDEYGGAIANRMRPLLEAIEATRAAVGPDFHRVKLNSSDQLEGGFDKEDALKVVEALDRSSVDLIDISGGTYFRGAKSRLRPNGTRTLLPRVAKRAGAVTTKPLMLTGGFKTRASRGRCGKWCG